MYHEIVASTAEPFAPPSQIYVPVQARGRSIYDNGGDKIAECFTEEMASRVAILINRESGTHF